MFTPARLLDAAREASPEVAAEFDLPDVQPQEPLRMASTFNEAYWWARDKGVWCKKYAGSKCGNEECTNCGGMTA